MSKNFTYLLAGLIAASVTLPAQVAAQSLKLNTSQIVHKFDTSKRSKDFKTPNKISFQLANSNRIPRKATNSTFNTPYLEEFNTQEAFNNFTVIDGNNDGITWEWEESDKDAGYRWSSLNTGDDWLITPGINLKAGKTYIVSYKASARLSSFHERIEAKWGQGTTVDAMTEELTPRTDITTNNWIVFSKEITPATDGAYNFGFHAISDPNKFYLYLDSISVIQKLDVDAPDSVTALQAEPDPTGELKVTLSFKAPTKKIDGSDLSEIDSIVVHRNGATISSIKAVNPGETLSVVDDNASAGENTYTVIAANDNGEGRPATISALAGPDVPNAPEVTAHDNLTSIKFTWPDVTGANGGIIVPSDVSYDIWSTNLDGKNVLLADSITTVKGVNEYDLNENTTEGDQELKYWAFNAHNSTGASQYSVAPVIVGTPYTIPFSNSFADGTLEDQFVSVQARAAYPTWALTAEESSDNDGGSAIFYNTPYTYGFTGDATFSTGKISLSGAQNPELIFSYNGSISTNARLVAELEHSNGAIDSLWSENFTNGRGTWQTATVKLPASIANEPYVFFRFHGIANNDDEQQIYVDNIHAVDPYQNDAAINIAAPTSINKGQDASIVATLSNQGDNLLSNLEVKISINDEIIKDTIIAQSLAIFDKVEIPATYKTTSTKDLSTLNVKAEVINAGDLDDSNNIATASIALAQAELNSPSGLQGSETSDSVKLSWTAPATSKQSVTDDFESYTAWATSNVGDWTFVNADNAPFGSLANGDDPNALALAAYEVWHPHNVFMPNEELDPHSGEQCLASIFKVNEETQSYVDADDWLISPELSGGAQTITFWVNNVAADGFGTESFQVLASSTDKLTSDFQEVGIDYAQASGTWKQISVELPEGSKYFAIRRITSGSESFIFFIDDITYEIGASLSSYNIYIDGEYAGSTTETSFSFESDGANHTYSVTAVYADGSESAPTTIDLVANSIDDIHAKLKADKYDVYTIGGAQVKIGAKSLNGLAPGVYVINGKKVILK